jgi:hypothetical protein
MRWMIVALALGAAACDGAVTTSDSGKRGATPEGYTMEVRADASQQTYLITAPDGRIVGAQSAADGASALMDTARARTLIGQPPPRMEEVPNVLTLRVPGFDMSIGGVGDGENGEGKDGDVDQGQVRLSVGGEHGQRVEVQADEGGPGEDDDHAFVRITGANEEAVREFLDDAEDLSPEVKTQMLAGLGLH